MTRAPINRSQITRYRAKSHKFTLPFATHSYFFDRRCGPSRRVASVPYHIPRSTSRRIFTGGRNVIQSQSLILDGLCFVSHHLDLDAVARAHALIQELLRQRRREALYTSFSSAKATVSAKFSSCWKRLREPLYGKMRCERKREGKRIS